jgi:hypothetical protein
MTAVTVLTICAVVATLTVAVAGVYLVRALIQVRRTAAQAEAVLRRAEPVLGEAEGTLREFRELGGHLAAAAERADRLTAEVEGLGTRARGAGRLALLAMGGPLDRAGALWAGVKAGLQVLLHLDGHRRRAPGRKEVPAEPRDGSFSDD